MVLNSFTVFIDYLYCQEYAPLNFSHTWRSKINRRNSGFRNVVTLHPKLRRTEQSATLDCGDHGTALDTTGKRFDSLKLAKSPSPFRKLLTRRFLLLKQDHAPGRWTVSRAPPYGALQRSDGVSISSGKIRMLNPKLRLPPRELLE